MFHFLYPSQYVVWWSRAVSALMRNCLREHWEKSSRLHIDMEWAKPAYARNQVDKAGVAILKDLPDIDDPNLHIAFNEYLSAVEIVNNWRSAHSYPLNCFQTNLRSRARKISTKPLVSQRLKRFESIVKKLGRDQTSTLEPNFNTRVVADAGHRWMPCCAIIVHKCV